MLKEILALSSLCRSLLQTSSILKKFLGSCGLEIVQCLLTAQVIPFLLHLPFEFTQLMPLQTHVVCAYMHESYGFTIRLLHLPGSLLRLPKEKKFEVTLEVLQCDVFTTSPIKVCLFLPGTRQFLASVSSQNLFLGLVQVYNQKIQFAPIGLINMYNSGGAVEAIDFSTDSSGCEIHVKGRGAGTFGAYSSTKPKSCSVNSKAVGFDFRAEDNLLTLTFPDTTSSWDVVICY